MSEFDDTSDMTDDECRQMLRVVAAERDALCAEVERLRNGRSILLAEIEMLRERIGNIIDPNDYGKGIWTRND